MRYTRGLPLPAVLLALLLALLAASCSQTARLIPGEATAAPAEQPETSPSPTPALPLLPPDTVTLAGGEEGEQTPGAVPDAELARSAVQIRLLDASGSIVREVRDGSGVVVDRDRRLILTSHVLVDPLRPDGTLAYSTIAVGVTRTPGDEPALEFEATLVAGSRDSGLAVLRVSREYRGDPLQAGDFDVPAVAVGDPDALARGDALRLLGYPGLDPEHPEQSQAVIAVTGTVTGFRGREAVQGRARIDTDVRLPHGAAGGPAFDASGALVGIAAQIAYDPEARVGQVLPLSLMPNLIEQAALAGPAARYDATPQHPVEVPISSLGAPRDGVWASAISFAENAVEGPGRPALFDYTSVFRSEPAVIYYEYALQGVPEQAIVEERWSLDGVPQDSVSSSFYWTGGSFGVTGDRFSTANPKGIPKGVWTLEVWTAGALRATASAYVGVLLPETPGVEALRYGSSASDGHEVRDPPSAAARQLLVFFDYEDAAGVRFLRWIVFRDGQVVARPHAVPWTGGDRGTWWVGFTSDEPVGAGVWEFELYLDGPDASTPVIRAAGSVEVN